MLPVLWTILRTYAPVITLPIAALIGAIGYNLEGILSDKYTPFKPSVEEQREERQLSEITGGTAPIVDTLEDHKFVPKSIFERNLSPQLMKK